MEVDTLKESFTADVFYQARWREPKLDGNKVKFDLYLFNISRKFIKLKIIFCDFFQRKSVRCVTVNLKLQSIFSFTKISLENRLWLTIHHCQKKRNEMRVIYFSAVSLFSYPLESHQRKHFIAKVLVSKFLAFFHFSGHACNTWSF